MTLPDVDFRTKESILKSIEKIADTLATKVVLKINDAYYRMIDFEFYVYTESNEFKDLHTYKGNLQRESNRLFLHYSGVDITLGDGENYGGILLRGVVRFDKTESGFAKEKIEGTQVVAIDFFSHLHPLDGDKKNEITLVEAREHIPDSDFLSLARLIKTKRIGLSSAPDKMQYRDEPLRYISIFRHTNDFDYKVKGMDGIIGELYKTGEIDKDEAKDILGYNKSFI